jgi:hypothetical protein
MRSSPLVASAQSCGKVSKIALRGMLLPPPQTAAAHALQLQLYRDAGPERRAEIAADLSEAIRAACRAGVRLRHPDFSEAQINREVIRIFYGQVRVHAG